VVAVLPAPVAVELSQTALDVLKYAFLALLFLFLARVVRVVVLELRSPTVAATGDGARGQTKRGGARLKIVEPKAQQGETYSLGDELTVGRGGGCGVVLADDTYVSTVHARLYRRGDDLFVEDLGSRNGTFVNGQQVQAPTKLRRGDRVQFGQTVGEVTR
jgi:pSer/pThr/pTyr-binding forkhead associated (FHA) protein